MDQHIFTAEDWLYVTTIDISGAWLTEQWLLDRVDTRAFIRQGLLFYGFQYAVQYY